MSDLGFPTDCEAGAIARRWAAFLSVAHATGAIAAIGSLVWKPIAGTVPVSPITIEGFRKDFNTRVTRCRGTPEHPGLVLGLEPDRVAVAHGMLLRVEPPAARSVWAEFSVRELGDADYVPTLVAARRCDTGEAVAAVAVLVDTRSASYVRETATEAARMIARATGTCGSNLDYVLRSLATDRAAHGGVARHLALVEAKLLQRPSSGSMGD